MREGTYIPKYLNSMPQVLWWELDEFMFLVIFTGFGILLDHQFLGIAAGYIIMKIYVRAKKSKQEGFLWHYLYWKGFYNLPRIPKSFVKVYSE